MKKYQLEAFGIDGIKQIETETPQPSANEVLINFKAFSLNFRDLMLIGGQYNPKTRFPAVPLSDGAGEIVAIGENVTRWKVGQRVTPIFTQKWIDGEPSAEKNKSTLGGGGIYDGVLTEYGVFNEEGLVEIPEYLSYEEAATLPCAAVTAWNALSVCGNLKPGETVLTLGTGGVSIFAVQIAKMFGAEVFSTSGSNDKLEKLKEFGVKNLINYKENEDWNKVVRQQTDGLGVDHVVEVGGAGTFQRSLNAVRTGGHVSVIGVLSAGAGVDPVSILMNNVRLQGILVGSRKMFEDMNRAFETNNIKPVIDKVFDFNDAVAAYEYMQSGAHFGKVVIKI